MPCKLAPLFPSQCLTVVHQQTPEVFIPQIVKWSCILCVVSMKVSPRGAVIVAEIAYKRDYECVISWRNDYLTGNSASSHPVKIN